MTLFLDANVIIYLVEGTQALQGRVAKALGKYRAKADPVAVSRLSWLECRVRPLREKNKPVLAEYEDFFATRDLVIVELSAPVIEAAAQLRAMLNFSTPDALQAASALQITGPVRFFSNDRRLANIPGLTVESV